MDYYSRNKDFVCGAVVGSAVAVLTTLLLSTKKGKQIQRKIADAWGDLEENVKDTYSEVKDKAEEVGDSLHKKVSSKLKSEESQKDSK